MTIVDVNGVGLACDDEGSGPALLLLHGFTGSARTWSRQLPALRRHHRTIVVDLLGHGRSEAVADPDRYRIDRQASDLATLMSAVDAPMADVVGYSMGARIALRLAIDHPRRIGRLVLESPSPGISDPAGRDQRVVHDERLAADMERDGIVAFVDTWEQQPLFASHAALADPDRAELRRERTSHDALALAASLRGAGQGAMEPMLDQLGSVAHTSLVIAGSLDEPGRDRAQAVAAAMPDARLEVVDDAGHTPHLERPDRFTPLLATFLDPATEPH